MINASAVSSKISGLVLEPRLAPLAATFCPGEELWDADNRHDVIPADPGRYEGILESFLLAPEHAGVGTGDRILVIVGGPGSGKSTALQRAIHGAQVRAGSKHRNPLEVVLLDFMEGWPPSEEIADGGEAEWFWRSVAARLVPQRFVEFPIEVEVRECWYWCLKQYELMCHSNALRTMLDKQAPLIEALRAGTPAGSRSGPEIVDALIEARGEFLATASARDQAWYRVGILAYVLRHGKLSDRPVVVVLDNIDHFWPHVQKLAADFVVVLGEVLRSRVVIAVRPLTKQNAVHGVLVVRFEPHVGPSPLTVVRRRVDDALRRVELSDTERSAVAAFARTLTGGDPLLTSILRSTAGTSSRHALATFTNALESPLLASLPEVEDWVVTFKRSRLARAVFFGSEVGLDTDQFEHLYSVGGDRALPFRLVKPRVLDLLVRRFGRQSKVSALVAALRQYGHENDVILEALTELLRQSRPLVWCEDGFRADKRWVDSNGRIAITATGIGYYTTLFGEMLYDEVCIATSRDHDVSMREVLDFHHSLAEQDLREIHHLRVLYGSDTYRASYPREACSLSVLHYRRLLVGLRKRAVEERGTIDPQRENKLEQDVEHVLAGRLIP